MFWSCVRRVVIAGSLMVGAAMTQSALAQEAPPSDCTAMQFDLSNPSPGTRVDPGDQVVQGIAYDARSEDGPGIDQIDFFLGNRDTGGVIIGHAIPSDYGPFDASSFQTTITVPKETGGRELFVYAHSSVTGDVSIISFPIAIGTDPNKAGPEMATPTEASCVNAPSGVAVDQSTVAGDTATTDMPAAAEDQTPPDETASVPAGDEQAGQTQMYLDISNPQPGDWLHVGALNIEGIAFDGAADPSPGIDHIDIFIDNRDTGGTLIGHAAMGAPTPSPDDPSLAGAGWAARVMLTNKMMGAHTMYFYAMSSAGEELVVGVPILVTP